MTRPTDSTFESELFETTTINSNNSQSETLPEDVMEYVLYIIISVYTPLLVIFGSIGNIISIVIFYRIRMRSQSTSLYLTALAVSDTLFLWLQLPPWLKATGASRIFTKNVYCQGIQYFSYVMCFTSSWIVVTFTLERFVAVIYPLRRNAMCTVRRARIVIGGLVVSAMAVNIPVLWLASPANGECNIDANLMIHAEQFNLFDTVFAFTVPLALIIILNAWIMAGVCRIGCTGGQLMRQQPPIPTQQLEPGRSSSTTTNRNHRQNKVTRMLLIVSSVFVLLNLPAYSMRIISYIKNQHGQDYNGTWATIQQISTMCFNTNFAINFVLYCFTGQNFRRELYGAIPFMRRRARELIAMHNLTGGRRRPARGSSISTLYGFSTSNNDASNVGASSGVRRAGQAEAEQGTMREGEPQPGTSRGSAPHSRNLRGSDLLARTLRGSDPLARTSRGSDPLARTSRGSALQARTWRCGAQHASTYRCGAPHVESSQGEAMRNEAAQVGTALDDGIGRDVGRSRGLNRVTLLRRRHPQVIQRWRFDNTRQRRERLELQPPAAAALPSSPRDF